MKNNFRFLAVALIAGGTMFAQPRVSIGIGVGGYAPGYYAPPAYSEVVPPCPGPDYVWVDGYWVPQGGRNVWVQGYWRRPYMAAYPVGPRYVAPRYIEPRGYNAYRGYERGYGGQSYGSRSYVSRGGERSEHRGGGYRR